MRILLWVLLIELLLIALILLIWISWLKSLLFRMKCRNAVCGMIMLNLCQMLVLRVGLEQRLELLMILIMLSLKRLLVLARSNWMILTNVKVLSREKNLIR